MLKLADLANRADFTLGAIRVSPARRRIAGPEGEINVEPLIMQVFLLLVEAKGAVVTRSHLFDECWGGVNVGDYSLNRAITMVRRIAIDTAPGAFEIENIPRTGYRLITDGKIKQDLPLISKWKSPLLMASVVAGIAGAGVAVAAWLLNPGSADEATFSLTPQDQAAVALAESIEASAMTTAAFYEAPMRLLETDNESSRATDFVLRVGKTSVDGVNKTELSLVRGQDKSLLWSWSATRPDGEAAPLDEMARETGAAVLACAAETRAGIRSPDQETVKLYLDACSKFDLWHGAELTLIAEAFERVTRKEPRLKGAWAKLFLAKAEAIEGESPPAGFVDSLKQDIRVARENHIDIAENSIAEAAVLPLNARFERLQLYEAALVRYPRNPFLLAAHSWQLRSVGRMDEAARTAQRMFELYPRSSAAATELANSLMSSGRFEASRDVLAQASALAPHATNLQWARWRLEMRYGDPKLALELARTSDRVVRTATTDFLEARINPTKANVDRAMAGLMARYREDPSDPGLISQPLGAFGRSEEAMQFLLHYPSGATSGDTAEMLFRPHLSQVRRDPRFMLIARNFGVTDYWIRSGILPDFCFDRDLAYDCRKELAALRKG